MAEFRQRPTSFFEKAPSAREDAATPATIDREAAGPASPELAARAALPPSLTGRSEADVELGAGARDRVVRAHDGLLHRDDAIELVDRTGPLIRGCATAPLRTHDGHLIGALRVPDADPHDVTPDDLVILTSVAAMVLREPELRLVSRRAVFDRRAAAPPGGKRPEGPQSSAQRLGTR